MDKSCWTKMIQVYGITFALFCAYSLYLVSHGFNDISENDFLNKKIFDINGFYLSGWGLSHIIMYFIIGCMYPYCWKEAMVIGIIWEAIETIMGSIFTNKPNKSMITNKTTVYDLWWSGSLVDLVFNAFGFLMGAGVAYYLKQRKGDKKI